MSDVSPLSFSLGHRKYTINQNKGATTINIVYHDGDTKYYRITKGKDTSYYYDKRREKKYKTTSLDFPCGIGYSNVEVSAAIELAEVKATMDCMLDNEDDPELAADRARLEDIMWNLIDTYHGEDYSD